MMQGTSISWQQEVTTTDGTITRRCAYCNILTNSTCAGGACYSCHQTNMCHQNKT